MFPSYVHGCICQLGTAGKPQYISVSRRLAQSYIVTVDERADGTSVACKDCRPYLNQVSGYGSRTREFANDTFHNDYSLKAFNNSCSDRCYVTVFSRHRL